mmetsp:Transcript_65166/g.172653  ORF Transcript_65166/g.172653 Transcript_65166/m.172653 type:complete len:252 (-) Transcript_65166:183-938(-)
MWASRLENLFQCGRCTDCDAEGSQHDFQLHMSSGLADNPHGQQSDSTSVSSSPEIDYIARPSSTMRALTPRQRNLRSLIELPLLHKYPLPPVCSPDASEEERKQKLLEMYQDFTLELHSGMYLTQLTSSRDYSDIHCQLMEDLQTLKLDQGNGRIVEFPLTGVSKAYRIVKNDDRWHSAASAATATGNTEHIVVVEFMRRKLAFVFKDLNVAQQFLLGMELLIRKAQQKQAPKDLRFLTPTFQRAANPTRN